MWFQHFGVGTYRTYNFPDDQLALTAFKDRSSGTKPFIPGNLSTYKRNEPIFFLTPFSLPSRIYSTEMSPDPKPDIFTYADFDLQALCRQASTLRQGVLCACDPDQRPASGSFNWAIFVSFEDRVRWVFRSPHPRTFMPMEMGIKLLASEAAMLRYLRAHSDIPVPEVYNYW